MDRLGVMYAMHNFSRSRENPKKAYYFNHPEINNKPQMFRKSSFYQVVFNED